MINGNQRDWHVAAVKDTRPLKVTLPHIRLLLFTFNKRRLSACAAPLLEFLLLHFGHALGRIVKPFLQRDSAIARPGVGSRQLQTFLD